MRISGQSILAAVRPEALENGKDPATFQGLNPGGAEGAFGYTIPNLLIDHAMRNPHVPPWFWRGVNNNQNAIYLECFMDELAHAAGQDPLEFRRKLMTKHPKHLAVLNAVAERVGWGKPAPQASSAASAQHMGYGSYVAACAEVSVNGNAVKIHRIVAATDCGHAVNPAQIERQIAGLVRLRPVGAVLRRLHRQGRPHRADQLRHLRLDAHRRDAEGRNDRHAVRRLLGRRRRADDLRRGAGGAQRDLRGDRQAHPLGPAARPRPADGVIKRSAAAHRGRRRTLPKHLKSSSDSQAAAPWAALRRTAN